MKPLRIHLQARGLTDAYLYAGHLFLVTEAGEIFAPPLHRIASELFERYPKFGLLITLCLQRNDWLENTQGQLTFSVPEIGSDLSRLWNRFNAANVEYAVSLKKDDFVCKANAAPLYELKLYAFNIFAGHGRGLDQIRFSIDPNWVKFHNGRVEKVFDARVVGLSANSGEIAISSGSTGLFHGTLWNESSKLGVSEKAAAHSSLRTSWMGTNLVNYSSSKDFEYLLNRTKKVAKRNFLYSKYDDDSRKIKIDEFAFRRIESKELIGEDPNVIGIFNSSTKYFYITRDRKLLVSSLIGSLTEGYHTSRFKKELQPSKLPNGQVLEAKVMRNALLLEYFDSVFVFHNGELQRLVASPVHSVRAFPGSVRYRKTACITHNEGVDLFCLSADTEPGKRTI